MPWTRKQAKLFESDASPLTAEQKDKMNAELHANPALGHAKKGSAALKKPKPEGGSHAMNWRTRWGQTKVRP